MCFLSCSVVSLFCHPMDCSLPGFSVNGTCQQEYWSVLPFPTLGDLPNPGLKPASPTSPALAGGFFTAEPPGKPGPLNVKVRLP